MSKRTRAFTCAGCRAFSLRACDAVEGLRLSICLIHDQQLRFFSSTRVGYRQMICAAVLILIQGAVDTLDMCVHTYTCARQTRRWPVSLFQCHWYCCLEQLCVMDLVQSKLEHWKEDQQNKAIPYWAGNCFDQVTHDKKMESRHSINPVRNRIRACWLINTDLPTDIPIMLHLIHKVPVLTEVVVICVRCARCRGQDVLLVIRLCVHIIWGTFVISVFDFHEKVSSLYWQYAFICLIIMHCYEPHIKIYTNVERYIISNSAKICHSFINTNNGIHRFKNKYWKNWVLVGVTIVTGSPGDVSF